MLMGFLSYEGMITNQKILLCSQAVKGKIAFGDSLSFRTQIEDLPLKGCILGKESKNNISACYIVVDG